MNTFRLRFIAVLIIAVVVQACSGGDPNIESAKLNIRNQDYTAAIASTDRAIEVNPDNHEAYIWKARALSSRAMDNNNIEARLPDYQSMIASLDKAQTILDASTDPKAMLSVLQIDEVREEAWRLEHATSVNYVSKDTISDQDFARSIAHMKNAVAIYPDSTLSSRALAEIYFLSGDLQSAATQMKTTVDKTGANAISDDYVRLLQFQREAGLENEVVATMEKAVQLFPGNKDVKIEVANTYLSRAEYDKAANTMAELISFEPDNAEYRYVYATLLFEAINNEITKLNDNYTVAFDLRSEYRETARQATSAANTQRMQAIEKELEDMNTENGAIGAEINRLGDTVIEQLTKATELEPTTAKYFSLLGSIYDVKDNVRFNEGNEQTDLAVADRMQNEAKEVWRKALPYMEKATELDPENRDNWATLSRVYIRLGMTEQAQRAMERSEQ
jgi:tetratricopeptide (TPR) repeat protein